MRRNERARLILKILNKIYPRTPIPLNHNNNYELLVSVLLSAQCTDERVNEVTPILFKEANNALKMKDISVDTIYNIVRPCGLGPKKSKAIKNLSLILADKFHGEVPESFLELEKLPGVGHKTASVVMSQGFNHPAFPVDTHIHRLSQRWGLTSGKNVVQTEKDLKMLFPKKSWNKLHLQIIFYGREFCKARSCYGIQCQICTKCYPNRKKAFIAKKA
ncbi:MAG: endonuclease III [Gammaproteobacteria bacterium]|jgi:endonuclease III|nr:endonuclease III [Gammaproteobacteria bacterium]MBT6754540.1 endonuclease III [Gammaproteobacteria bacterium]MBT7814579.1 endonuclease III [Gammaproteobacteria bacterium]|tara:strand:- start:524 stop:1177 length:654 start_codon:yes stop_codon:yes gene_type:complete